jgi:hypothetical protein
VTAWSTRTSNPRVSRSGGSRVNLARRVYVAPAASDAAVDYLTGVGHGLEDLYTGDYGDPIFQVGSYDSREVNPKIAHFLSCQTAARLGPDFVRNGCKAYFGYDVNFAFTFEQKDLFFECDSEIDRALADGLNAGQTYRRVRKLYETRITELRQAGKFYVASILENDLEHLRSPADGRNWGATSARLS